jgi:predicted secreted protein
VALGSVLLKQKISKLSSLMKSKSNCKKNVVIARVNFWPLNSEKRFRTFIKCNKKLKIEELILKISRLFALIVEKRFAHLS